MTSTPTKPHIHRHVPSNEADVLTRLLPNRRQLSPRLPPQPRLLLRYPSPPGLDPPWLFLEGLYLLPHSGYRYPRPVELRKVIRGIIIHTRHHIWPEAPFCKLLC